MRAQRMLCQSEYLFFLANKKRIFIFTRFFCVANKNAFLVFINAFHNAFHSGNICLKVTILY